MNIKSFFLAGPLLAVIGASSSTALLATEYERKPYDPYEAGLLAEPECHEGLVCIQRGVIKLQDKIRKDMYVMHKADLLVMEAIRLLAANGARELAASRELIMLTGGREVFRDLVLQDYQNEEKFRNDIRNLLLYTLDPMIVVEIVKIGTQLNNRIALEEALETMAMRDWTGAPIDIYSKLLSTRIIAYDALGNDEAVRQELEDLKQILSASRGEGGGVMYAQRALIALLKTGKYQELAIDLHTVALETNNWADGTFIDMCILAFKGKNAEAQMRLEDRLAKNEALIKDRLNADFKMSHVVTTFQIVQDVKRCGPSLNISRIEDDLTRIAEAVKDRDDVTGLMGDYTVDFLMARHQNDKDRELQVIQEAIQESRKANYSANESTAVIELIKLAAKPLRVEVN